MIKNVLKIVFLGVVGFGLLVYLTAEKPKNFVQKVELKKDINFDNFPKFVKLVGSEKLVESSSLFKDEKTLLIVANHDSLSIVKDFNSLFNSKLPLVVVANISSAPWFVKEWIIPKKLEELNSKTISMIYDDEGNVVNSLLLNDSTKTKFFAYIVENKKITKIYEGNVKENAMDGSMSEEEIKVSLKPLFELLNQ